MRNSRLKENTQKKTVRNIMLAICVIILLVSFILIYGIKLLINFSMFMSGASKDQNTANISSSITYIPPPILNPTTNATNSAKIKISGSSTKQHLTIDLYVNGQQVDETGLKTDNTFSFENVSLAQGSNSISAKAVTTDNQASGNSNTIQINYITNSPVLNINSPQDGQTFNMNQSPVLISGKTYLGDTVKVNTFSAIVDGQGNFSYQYSLQQGDNDLKISSTDQAGNNTQKEIHIKTK